MKNLKFLFTTLLLLCSTITFAEEVIIDGIKYDVIAKAKQAKVISNGYSGDIIIPETVVHNGATYSVTSIGDRVFYNCDGLTSIEIPNSVTSIGNYAFYYCSGLESIIVDSGNTNYDSRDNCNAIIETGSNTLLYGCNNSVIPNSVTSIGDGAFSGRSGLTSVTIPNSVTSIGGGAFSGCSGLTSIEIPNSVTSIGDNAFYNCDGLTSIEIPNSVTSIGNYAFEYCSGLTSVTIGNSVTSIGDYAFSHCSELACISVASGNTVYDSRNNCNAIIKTATNTLIQGCKNTIIPNSVTSIGSYAFSGCSGLTSIEIPNSVTSIGEGAFYDCYGLDQVYCLATNVPSTNDEWGNNWNPFDNSWITLYVPSVAINSYKTTWPWSNFGNFIEIAEGDVFIDGINYYLSANTKEAMVISEEWGDYYYYGDIIIPSEITYNDITYDVTSIGSGAFSGCWDLTSIEIPNSITSIGSSAFRNCNLKTVHISDLSAWCNIDFGNEYSNPLSYHNLYLNGNLVTELVIPDGITEIKNSAFYGCTGLTSIEIPNSVTSIGSSAFYYCSGLVSVVIPNSVTNIGDGAFEYCSGLTNIEFNAENCTTMGSSSYPVFGNCTSLSTVTIGENVKNIPAYAFRSCYGLTSVTIPNSVTSIGEFAFEYCSGLTSIEIPNGVTSIEEGAFSGCSGLTSFEIPNSVTSIGGVCSLVAPALQA